MSKIDYERTDYAQLAKEFNCQFRIGKYGINFWHKGLGRRKLVVVTPLDGWITDEKEVERIIRERGLEL